MKDRRTAVVVLVLIVCTAAFAAGPTTEEEVVTDLEALAPNPELSDVEMEELQGGGAVGVLPEDLTIGKMPDIVTDLGLFLNIVGLTPAEQAKLEATEPAEVETSKLPELTTDEGAGQEYRGLTPDEKTKLETIGVPAEETEPAEPITD